MRRNGIAPYNTRKCKTVGRNPIAPGFDVDSLTAQ